MKEVISDTLAAMDQLFKEKNIEVEARLPEKVSAVTADLDRMIQVMLNLLSNAVKFCDRGERPDRDRARRARRLACGSTCATTAPASARRTRRPSSASSIRGATLTDKPHGSGLGLHISRQIIEHFGGRMWVESRPGAGACFCFTLPAEHAAMQQAEDANQL